MPGVIFLFDDSKIYIQVQPFSDAQKECSFLMTHCAGVYLISNQVKQQLLIIFQSTHSPGSYKAWACVWSKIIADLQNEYNKASLDKYMIRTMKKTKESKAMVIRQNQLYILPYAPNIYWQQWHFLSYITTGLNRKAANDHNNMRNLMNDVNFILSFIFGISIVKTCWKIILKKKKHLFSRILMGYGVLWWVGRVWGSVLGFG